MSIKVTAYKPFIILKFLGTDDVFFPQECLLDTGFQGTILFYKENAAILQKLEVLAPFEDKDNKFTVANGVQVSRLDGKIGVEVSTVQASIAVSIMAGGNAKSIPVVGMKFLSCFKADIHFNFLKKDYSIEYLL